MFVTPAYDLPTDVLYLTQEIVPPEDQFGTFVRKGLTQTRGQTTF